jgi:CMP-N,N'-diacetyllegionaminic acid synthase
MSVTALITARQGSKGLPGKNSRLLGGHPLIAYSICAARQCTSIDRVIVSTDSEDIAAIGRAYGAAVPFIRPRELAQDDSPDLGVVMHALQWLKREDAVPEFIVHLRPTTPLRDPLIVDKGVELLVDTPSASALRSVHEAAESPFKWFLMRPDACLIPFRAGDGSDYSAVPRQLVPKVFIPNGYVDVLRVAYIDQHQDLHGSSILGFITPPVTEIDTAAEFEYVEYTLRRNPHALLTSLNHLAMEPARTQQ